MNATNENLNNRTISDHPIEKVTKIKHKFFAPIDIVKCKLDIIDKFKNLRDQHQPVEIGNECSQNLMDEISFKCLIFLEHLRRNILELYQI